MSDAREPKPRPGDNDAGDAPLRPFSVVDTASVEAPRRAELLSDAYAANSFFSARFPKPDMRSRIENWSLPGMAATRQVSDANQILHTGGPSCSAPDLVYVRMHFNGSATSYLDGRRSAAGPGDIVIIDSNAVGTVDFSARRTLATYFPRSELMSDSSGPLPDVIRGASPAGRLLGSTLRAFDEALSEVTAAQAVELATGTMNVIRALLDAPDADLDREDFAQARRAAILAHIDEAIGREPLSSELLRRRFALSRATLYRLFKDHGGVESYLIEQRLLRCFAELAAARPQRGAVERIAKRWGFDDPSKFSHQFSRRFEARPTDVLGASRATGPEGNALASVRRARFDSTLRHL